MKANPLTALGPISERGAWRQLLTEPYLVALLLGLLFFLGRPGLLAADPSSLSPEWLKSREEALVRIEYSSVAADRDRSAGSKHYSNGIVVSPDGIILTVAHGLGKGTPRVILRDSAEFRARVILRNTVWDVAVLKIDTPTALTFAPMNFSNEKLRVVWSLGRDELGTLFVGQGETLAQGINLTGKELKVVQGGGETPLGHFMILPNLILHGAMIPPGHSGGPLLNSAGEVVGINFGRAGTQERGISFSMGVGNYQRALNESTTEAEALASELKDSRLRYDWFLEGIRQCFSAEGLAPAEIQEHLQAVTADGQADFLDSWRRFAHIQMQKLRGRADHSP